jgi:hypothetical protein
MYYPGVEGPSDMEVLLVSEQPRVFLSPRALEMYQREASLEGEPLYEALEKEMALRNCGVSSAGPRHTALMSTWGTKFV